MFTAGYLTLPEQQSIYGTGDFGQYSYLDGKGGGVYDLSLIHICKLTEKI